jgi:aminopeptidase N
MKQLSILSTLLLSAGICMAQTAAKDSVQNVTLDTLAVTAPAGAPPYHGATPKVWEIKNTRIALTFDGKEKTAGVREWIKLHPFLYDVDTLVLDAKGMLIDSVEVVSKAGNAYVDYMHKNDQLYIRFKKPYKATDSLELFLKYTSTPYAPSNTQGGSRAINDDRGLYFINTDYKVPHKPSQIWTQGETESNSHWMITIDKPNTRFTTQVELTVPDSFVTLGNGALVKQSKGKDGLRTDIWKMDMPIQAYAVMFAIGKFSIVKDKWRGRDMNYYVEPEYAPYARLMFQHTGEMIDFFSKRTGVLYPWNKYDQVVVRDYVSGAMENTTASLFGEFMNQNAREIADKNSEDVVSHELFHMWFGDYVTAESWSNITVNESFANYGEQLWRAFKYGKAEGDELAYDDLQGYLGASMANDPQLVRYNYDSREEVFDAISYNKGGATLRYMNSIMGDAAFDKAMNLYLTRNALHSGEAQLWRVAVEQATGQDWNWFFNQWYFHAGHPVVKVVYNYNDTTQKLTVTVNQNQDDSTFMYDLPLKTALIYGNDKSIINWRISKRRDTFTYNYKNGVRPVLVPDVEHVLPGELKDGKKPWQCLAQYTNCNDYVNRRLALSVAGRLASDSSAQAIIDFGLIDDMPSIRRHALGQLSNVQSDKYRRRWTAKVMAMATGDKNNLVRAEAFEVLGEWKVAAAKQSMIAVLRDSSYAVAGKALDAISKMDKDTAYILARQMVNTDPKGSLENAIWAIIGRKGADEDVALYEKQIPYVSGQKKFAYAFSLNSYLKNVKSEASFKRGVDVYTTMVISENMKSYRSPLAGFMFQVADGEKSNVKSADKEEAAAADKRLSVVKTAMLKIQAAEQDPEARKDIDKSMKNTFE